MNRFFLMALVLSFNGAWAQGDYPGKPVRMVVGFAAGGISDVLGRAIAIPLSKQLGQQVIVENKPGAGTTIAGDFIARSAPDGYNIWLQDITTHAINNTLYPKLPYDSTKDFSFVAMVASTPLMLVVHPSTQAASVVARRQDHGREARRRKRPRGDRSDDRAPGCRASTIVLSLGGEFLGPKGMDRALVRRLNDELAKAVRSSEMQLVWQNLGADPIVMTPEAFEAATAREIAKLAPVVKASGARLE